MASVPYVFTLEVDGFDIENDDVVSRFSADTVEAYPAVADGQVTITYNVTSDHPFDAVLDALNHLKRFDPSICVRRVLPDLVNISDIASKIGAPRDTVRSWVTSSRGPGNFPQPYATIGRGVRLWDWSAVNEWLRINHTNLSEDEHFLSREELDWINASLARMQWKLQNSSVLISEYAGHPTQTFQEPSLSADLHDAGFYTIFSTFALPLRIPASNPQNCLIDLSSYRLIPPVAASYWGSSLPHLTTVFNYGTAVSMTGEELSPSSKAIWAGIWHLTNSSEMNEDSEIQVHPTTTQNTPTKVPASPGNSSSSLVAYPSSKEGDRP